MIELVLGGARSGKSRHAESVIRSCPGPWTYIATGRAWDAEMAERIALHRADRGDGWVTVEEPVDLPGALEKVEGQPVLVDCLTLWLTNLLLENQDIATATDALMQVMERRVAPLVLVGNEVGLGIVPDNALARRFRDEAGRLHQRVAARADRVVLCVAGIPMTIRRDV
ncbi:bifunctional adenosylcobinamide kinase/adenosylcobinamide-phosphate guanylyltransferase [Acetobacter estunensis]|uniref:bifunctional adenosylcobinamide kinase/adenosylcobinamide-phosphate guanylyltransferase n=1 Tax=Acetobacter estunensis TaxID=104097 RepID=UPI001C2DE3DE|nr:bifunctional adenosylcobinamide kinase/adenosylcobinamide-phosphate guanylyltransferase [Acetobacter estunensis]MBV1836178.1 bifunctional adenosylcobinamide kinase/adenosylcobinamide-phosphate guanylyltransferase [Acetobacter estunensis]